MAEKVIDRTIIDVINNYIKKISEKYEIKEVYLFGSYAKGSNHRDSDIDIAIISDDFNNKIQDMVDLMLLTRGIDLRIEPHPFTTEEFEELNPFIVEIKDTGLKVA